jgi:predicted O-methyltransferase YrrM
MSFLTYVLGALVLILLVTLYWVGQYALKYRFRVKGRPLIRRLPVRQGSPEEVDPLFAQDELGTTPAAEVMFVAAAGAKASTSDRESWILAVLAKRAGRIFEFGTCTGRTTYLMARNAPEDAVVETITLDPGTLADYRRNDADPDARKWEKIALSESLNTRFYYEGTPVAHKVRQHFGDSTAFDETPLARSCDLVFVDGSHAYSYVVSDSRKALAMVAPGGIVAWHDYSHRCPGVFRALNELAKELPLLHVTGTTLVVYRDSGNSAPAA